MPSPRLVVRHARRTLLATAAGGLAAVVFASSALAETDSVRFEFGENGTWTVPDRVTEIEVEVAGAGGGGGNRPGISGGGGMGNIGSEGGITAARGGGAGGSTAHGTAVSLVDGESSFYSTAGGAGGVAASGGDGWVVITWVIPPPLPDPEVATDVASVPREPVVLTLTMRSGMACSAPVSDASGAWIQLPAANECGEGVSSGGRFGEPAGLLGWATTPDFPVAIAQRQVSNDWGTYELKREDGSLEAVFIPAGGWAQASSDTTLFPIWAS